MTRGFQELRENVYVVLSGDNDIDNLCRCRIRAGELILLADRPLYSWGCPLEPTQVRAAQAYGETAKRLVRMGFVVVDDINSLGIVVRD